MRFDRFNVAAWAVIGVLLGAIVTIVAAGDRVGVGVLNASPQGQTHTTSAIHVTFGEAMDRASVEARFDIEPPIPGKISWSGQQLTFKPATALAGGQRYNVTIHAGAVSALGRRLVADIHWTFDVSAPRVVYLAPAVPQHNEAPNLWMVDPANTSPPVQLTKLERGVMPEFAPSPDGTRIAFAQKGDGGTVDLYVLTVDTGAIQRITQCVQAACEFPDWSPDSTRIAYQRTELNANEPRAWIVNLADLSTAPLLASSQLLGKEPRWSPDGTQIAVFDDNLHSILIYDLARGDSKGINSQEGDTGLFDPTGTRMVFPDIVQTQQGFYTSLSLATISGPNTGIQPISAKDSSVIDDRQAAWLPDGKHIAVTRQYLDERGTQGAQIYLIDLDTGSAQPLVLDDQYNHAAISWDPAGQQLVMQRFPYFGDNPQPGLWVYDLQTKALREIAENGFLPQWLP